MISWSSKIITVGTVANSQRISGSRHDSRYSFVYSSKDTTWSAGPSVTGRPAALAGTA